MNSIDNRRLEIVVTLCRELRVLARREEERAADEAARTPYWVPYPPSVLAHRAAACALREDAERLESRGQLPEAS